MNAKEMWKEFSEKIGVVAKYEAWQFGDDPDRLAGLVLCGKKTSTASALSFYAEENEPLPQAGEYSVILDMRDRAVCIIRTTKVYNEPFNAVSPEHAFKEGEGDRSLEYWREVHRRFFTEELKSIGLEFSEDMMVVCEEFELVYKPGAQV